MIRTYHSVFFNYDVVRLAFTLSASQNIRCEEMKLIRQDQRSFTNFFHMGVILCFFPAIFVSSSHMEKKNICFSMNMFPIRQVSLNFRRTVFLTTDQVHVRINFILENPLDLQCFNTILALCVVEDVSRNWTF